MTRAKKPPRPPDPANRADPEPKALACYGLWLPEREQMLLRFVDGRPVSAVTCAFLAWAAEQLAAEGVRVLALIWGNASWHISQEVRSRAAPSTDQAAQPPHQGCRLRLPSVGLSPAEPKPPARPPGLACAAVGSTVS
jgi:hypothetical protein